MRELRSNKKVRYEELKIFIKYHPKNSSIVAHVVSREEEKIISSWQLLNVRSNILSRMSNGKKCDALVSFKETKLRQKPATTLIDFSNKKYKSFFHLKLF